VAVAALAAVLAFALAGCGGSSGSSSSAASSSAAADSSAAASEDKVITVAASPTPHAQILNEAVKPALEKEGWTLEVKEFTDYVLPNTATEDGEVDANYFQHAPYLNDFNEQNGTHLVSVAGIHVEPMKIYAGKTASLDALADGAKVAVPNDTTNEARALLLLAGEGLIKLDDPTNPVATTKNITENPHNLEFVEVEAATVPTVLADVDIAVINGNYAMGANLSDDLALATETATNNPYVNVVVVKEGNEKSDKTKALVDAITSQDVKDFITKTYNGEVIPV
jgi:D-methionine transport system substrate-binding protein